MALGKSWLISQLQLPHLQHGWVRLCSLRELFMGQSLYEADSEDLRLTGRLYLSSGSLYLIPGPGLEETRPSGSGIAKGLFSDTGRLCQHPQAPAQCSPHKSHSLCNKSLSHVGRWLRGLSSQTHDCGGGMCTWGIHTQSTREMRDAGQVLDRVSGACVLTKPPPARQTVHSFDR